LFYERDARNGCGGSEGTGRAAASVPGPIVVLALPGLVAASVAFSAGGDGVSGLLEQSKRLGTLQVLPLLTPPILSGSCPIGCLKIMQTLPTKLAICTNYCVE